MTLIEFIFKKFPAFDNSWDNQAKLNWFGAFFQILAFLDNKEKKGEIKMLEDQEKIESIYLTEFEKDDRKYAGPNIIATSWEEAESKAREILKVVGVLDSSEEID